MLKPWQTEETTFFFGVTINQNEMSLAITAGLRCMDVSSYAHFKSFKNSNMQPNKSKTSFFLIAVEETSTEAAASP